jgi:hypothetical protein
VGRELVPPVLVTAVAVVDAAADVVAVGLVLVGALEDVATAAGVRVEDDDVVLVVELLAELDAGGELVVLLPPHPARTNAPSTAPRARLLMSGLLCRFQSSGSV